jgi:hypothetical protein
MKIKIEETKLVNNVIERDVNFPYIAWYSNKKDEIIKIYYEYGDVLPNIPKFLKCITIRNGWNINPLITIRIIHINNGIISDDIIQLLRDYTDMATEQEYNYFKQSVLKYLD